MDISANQNSNFASLHYENVTSFIKYFVSTKWTIEHFDADWNNRKIIFGYSFFRLHFEIEKTNIKKNALMYIIYWRWNKMRKIK